MPPRFRSSARHRGQPASRPVSTRSTRRERARHAHRGFLSIHRRILAVSAAALAFSLLGVHDLPAQAAVTDAPTRAAPPVVRTGFVVPAAVRLPDEVRDDYGTTELDLVMWPVAAGTRISSPFGHRVAPCSTCSTQHQGVDFVPGSGTPVAAITDGVVTEAAATSSGELGVHVIIRNTVTGDTVESVYGHLMSGTMPLRVGDQVKRGQIVGLVGSTGESTGPHLHFGILRDHLAIDPIAWMRAHVNS